jgi:hypothetical protein
MLRKMGWVLGLGLLAAVLPLTAAEADGDEMVDNPKYKMWAGFKVGSNAVHVETNKLATEDKSAFPDGVDEKVITYTLLSVSDKQVVVRVVVVEKEHLGTIESAPTKATYPAKVKKSHLMAVMHEFGLKPKEEEEMVKVGDKEVKCKVLAGTTKKGDEATDFKVCFSETVPGGIVKRMRTAKHGDKAIAETTIVLRSFREGPAPKGPPKDGK